MTGVGRVQQFSELPSLLRPERQQALVCDRVINGLLQPLVDRNERQPAELVLGLGDIRETELRHEEERRLE